MLRTKTVEIAGQQFTIANLTLGAQRRFNEGLEAIQADPSKALADGVTLQRLYQAIVMAALQRASSAVTVDALDPLDLEDLKALFHAIVAWTGETPGKKAEAPAGETPSP